MGSRELAFAFIGAAIAFAFFALVTLIRVDVGAGECARWNEVESCAMRWVPVEDTP